MRKHRGFALLWAVSAVSIIFLLGGTAFFALQTALRYEQALEEETDEIFLAQEVMEVIKYNRISAGALPIPAGETVRNGRKYRVEIKENHRTVEGVAMQEISCTVTDKKGASFSIAVLLEAR